MKIIFNSDLKANLSIDDNENVRHINHIQEHYKSNEDSPLDAAINYLENMSKILKIPAETLTNMHQKISYTDPLEQDVQYQLSEQKQFSDFTIVIFYQTFLNLPIWQAGLTVTIKHSPYRIIHAVNTSQDGFDAELPSSDVIERYKKLFHTNVEIENDAVSFIRSLTNKDELKKENQKREDNAHLIRGRFYVYKYDKDSRLPKPQKVNNDNEFNDYEPILPLYPVNDKIKNGHYYVVTEITFSFTTEEYGKINWIALVELETRSILYLRALAASNGHVFKHDPMTVTGSSALTPNQTNFLLNVFRSWEVLHNLDPPVAGTQSLRGAYANITNVEGPNIVPPILINIGQVHMGTDFNFIVRTDNFSAVNAYYHTDRFFSLVANLGFPIADYFNNTTFPIPVDHRGRHLTTDGIEVNAHCVGNGTGGIDHCCYCLADLSNTTEPNGIADDWRVVLHELGGHGILYENVGSANFGFSHSAGDSLAVILSDPESHLSGSDRFWIFPWVKTVIGRRCDRDVLTWAWGGGANDDKGYGSEQILATCHFRIYRSIGGDSTDIDRKRFAARMMAYLILGAVKSFASLANPTTALDFALALIKVDDSNWVSEGVFGGAYKKVIRWAFEKQGLYQPPGAPIPVTTPGTPEPVDVYIDDGRHGEYQFQPIPWNNTSIWNRRIADAGLAHEVPTLGSTNYTYVKIKNRGTQTANNVKVRGYHNKTGAGQLLPNDFQSLSPSEISVGTVAGNNTEEKIIGPFQWTPVRNNFGYDSIIMIASADGDASNIDNFMAGESIPDWRLVPNDNNIGQRNIPVDTLWHTIRYPTGWHPWGDVSGTVSGNPGMFKNIACESIGVDLHLVGLTEDGNMWHTIRYSDGSWHSWGNVSTTVSGTPGAFKNVTCSSIGNDLHVVSIAENGNMWHTIRYSDGSWQPWGDVSTTVSGTPGAFKNVTCSSIGNDLHVVSIAENGNMWHTIRFPTGWQPWGDVSAAVTGNPGINFKTVACSSIGNDLHVVSIAENGNMWHTIRFPTGWQPWGDVSAAVTGNPGINFRGAACSSILNNLHVVAVAHNGIMWHTIRFPTEWQPWGDVSKTVAGNSGTGVFSGVDCDSISQDIHVIGLT